MESEVNETVKLPKLCKFTANVRTRNLAKEVRPPNIFVTYTLPTLIITYVKI